MNREEGECGFPILLSSGVPNMQLGISARDSSRLPGRPWRNSILSKYLRFSVKFASGERAALAARPAEFTRAA